MAESAKGKDPIEPQPLNLKTWVLKASVHCEGCKKKVKKILRETPGVYSSDVDLKLQKVTVTGNIDVNALIGKLIKKTGKHAEIWPELQKERLEVKLSKPKPKRKPRLDDKVNVEEANRNEEGVAEVKPKSETTERKPTEQSASGDEAKKIPTGKSIDADPGGAATEMKDEQAKPPSEEKSEECEARKTQKETAGVKPEKKEEKRNAAVDGSSASDMVSGNVGKNNKKKAQKGKQKFEEPAGNQPNPQHLPTNHSPPRHFHSHIHGSPTSFHALPQYTVSYNTTPYHSSTYGSSYYATPPPHTEEYAYSSSSAEYQPSDLSSNQSQPLDTFQIFSDENPNACSLM